MEEKQKGDDGDDIKENEEKLKRDEEKKAQNEDDEAKQKDSVTIEQDNGKDNKEKDSVKRLPLNTLGTRFPVRGLGGRGILIYDTPMFIPPPPSPLPPSWGFTALSTEPCHGHPLGADKFVNFI